MHSSRLAQHSINSPQPNRRFIFRLISTSLWGFFETLTLNIVHFIDKYIWVDFHTRFMRLIHDKFGGIVTPFDSALESDPLRRNWKQRTPYTSYITAKGQEYIKKGQLMILPTQEIFNLLIRSNVKPSVSICYCRNHQKKQGHQCVLDAPLRTCLTLRLPQPISTLRSSQSRLDIDQQKALYALLLRCEKIGLVHQVVFYEKFNTYVICNCCPDCCEILSEFFRSVGEIKYHQRKLENFTMLNQKRKNFNLSSDETTVFKKLKRNYRYHAKGADQDPIPLVAQSAFISIQDPSGECINCGKCSERCYFGARVMKEGRLEYNSHLCYGCGLCASQCVQSVIQLKKRPKIKEMSSLGIGIKHEHPHYT